MASEVTSETTNGSIPSQHHLHNHHQQQQQQQKIPDLNVEGDAGSIISDDNDEVSLSTSSQTSTLTQIHTPTSAQTTNGSVKQYTSTGCDNIGDGNPEKSQEIVTEIQGKQPEFTLQTEEKEDIGMSEHATNHEKESSNHATSNGVHPHTPMKKTPSKLEMEEALKKYNLPVELPSLSEIRKSLPPHVFESSVATSMYYVVKDVAIMLVLYLVAEHLYSCPSCPWWLLWVVMPVYWLIQGTMFWAVFVLGHDCGHTSFSKHQALNDVMGNVLHSFLLCPYYCWKLSHRQHHAFTGNIDKDEVFYPIKECEKSRSMRFLPVFGFGASWYMYLFVGYSPRNVNHFNPSEPMFSRHVGMCTVSISMVLAWFTVLVQLTATHGFLKVLVLYGVPEFIFATYLVLTTFLHHTDDDVPWYDDSMWSFVRGQLSSVDRDYGWCHDIVHNIGTHQIHHLFSTIPHYNLEEATAAFRSKYPHLVRKSDERLLPAFVRVFYVWLRAHFVPDNALIHTYS